MAYCPVCTEKISANATKCENCGTPINFRVPGGGESDSDSATNAGKFALGLVITVVVTVVLVVGISGFAFRTRQAPEVAAVPKASTTDVARAKSIASAFHGFHENAKELPSAAVTDQDGRPFRSWRVDLLPFLDGGELALRAEYRDAEPWDSVYHTRLLTKMPVVYDCAVLAARRGRPETFTAVMLVTGSECAFDVGVARRFDEITDGTSNTLSTVEVETPNTHWLQPEDLPLEDLMAPRGLKRLASRHHGGFHALMLDGSVRLLPQSIDSAVFRALATMNAADDPETGEPLAKSSSPESKR